MKNRKILMILVITFMLLILGVGLFFLIKGDNYDLKNISVIDSDAKDFSEDIVFDGNHYKISDPIFEEENNLFISLNDLKEVIPIEITENNNEMKISHNGESILYNDKVIQNSNANENEVQQYRIKNEIIYIPERHIEKYLGVEVTYFYDSKTKTVALTSRKEQQLEKIDQQLGSTIFIEKNNVQTEKFEPRNGLYLGGYVIQDEYINASMNTFNEITNKQHASYFRYVGYGKPFPEEWVENVKSVGGFPQIAWEPNNGLDEVIDDDYLREFAKSAKEAGVPILLRYASEMNGTWLNIQETQSSI
ncbi:hypothetical protein JCM21714_1424 [Gracilibacillus boraciitolerans JCM 21714]|uniref:Uncharacterized protein n=1 Tax=Gracilibacillus boraciitolerans JCM 21714 TaxID=1298598 RepID=W4VGC6_9BACI|nr:hypothetical protein JCM21714_1424 [Gracilibacillus boraciitolerans JCM 21714]